MFNLVSTLGLLNQFIYRLLERKKVEHHLDKKVETFDVLVHRELQMKKIHSKTSGIIFVRCGHISLMRNRI